MKKALIILGIICIAVAIGIVIYFNITTFEGFRFKVVNGEVVITKYVGGERQNVVIPSYINNNPVTEIAKKAFFECNKISGIITIPKTVKVIGEKAFLQCNKIEAIKLTSDAPQIESDSFGTILVKYPYEGLGYDEACWENINTKKYNIPIEEAVVEQIKDEEYTGAAICPKTVINLDNEILIEGKDFVQSYTNNVQSGTATITATGIGDFIGSKEINFSIIPKDIKQLNFNKVEDITFTGEEVKPNVVVKNGTVVLTLDEDYKISYKNNKNVGKATIIINGSGNYTGSKKIEFNIKKADINDTKITGLKDIGYTGGKTTQTLSIKYNNVTLKKDKDYTLSYKNNVNLGMATVTVTGIGNFYSSKKMMYKVTLKNVSELKYNKIATQLYTGSAITPNVVVKNNGIVLEKGKDYTISYSNNIKVGTAYITIKGKENYTGTKKISFNIEKESYYIKVNYKTNVVTIYKGVNGKYDTPVKAMVCSTGTDTPRSGKYTIKSRWTWLKLYGGVYGHYVTQIVGDILFHSVPYLKKSADSLEYWEYDKLGTKASMGCIRLTAKDAKWIYDNIKKGTIVEFYSSSNPGPLGKPEAMKISKYEEYRNWDPTDPSSKNPWKEFFASQEK